MRSLLAILVLLAAACGPAGSTTGTNNGNGSNVADAGVAPTPDAGEAPVAECGNGELEDGEACDDGNLEAGDGCSAECTTEAVEPEDDHGDTVSDASRLPVGAPQRGIFEKADDVDVFAMTIALEGSFSVGAEGAGTLACTITDATGQVLSETAEQGLCGAILTLTPGVYHLSVALEEGEVPSRYMVQLQARDEGPEGGACGDGERNIGEGCDDGNTVAGDGCDSNCQPELGDDQQADVREQAAQLALDASVESAINAGGDVDYYAFTTDQAGEYQMGTTGTTDTYCHLEDANGEEIATNDDGGESLNCELIEELEAGTRYFLKIRGFSETRVGAYAVSVRYLIPPVCGNGELERNEACDDGNVVDGDGCDANCVIEDDFGNDIENAHAIQDPSTTEGNLIEADEDFFRFTASESGERQIHTASEIDTYCHLFDGQGNELATSDDDGDRLNCQIRHELTAGQSYLIKVRGFSGSNTGDYVLHLGPVVQAP
jgi:cysteine-rich repeat protein